MMSVCQYPTNDEKGKKLDIIYIMPAREERNILGDFHDKMFHFDPVQSSLKKNVLCNIYNYLVGLDVTYFW